MLNKRLSSGTGDSLLDHKYAELGEHDREDDEEHLLPGSAQRSSMMTMPTAAEAQVEADVYNPYAAYDRHAAKERRASAPRSVMSADEGGEVPVSPQAASVHGMDMGMGMQSRESEAIEMGRIASPAPPVLPPPAQRSPQPQGAASQRSPPPSYNTYTTPF